jgi:dTDP-4-amino-4,6-dideoxygalactose transaminase
MMDKRVSNNQSREDVSLVRWPYYDEEQIQDVVDVLQSGEVNAWTGPHVRNFEIAYANHLGLKHAIGLVNGTVALELALHALGLKNGDEVIVTPRSFFASASCVPFTGGVPVFADVDRDSQNLSAETIAPRLTARTKGIIVVHLAGWPCDMSSIVALARKHNLWIIEDCAQAHGAYIDGLPVGSFGDIAAFSFCQDKIITTGGEGGLIAMNDEALWKKAWSRKDHGKSYDTVFNVAHPPGFRWLHEEHGTNWRMTSIQAVLGLRQLERLQSWNEVRARNAAILAAATHDLPALRTPLPPANVKHAWYRFYTFVRPERLKQGWNRDAVMAEINGSGTACFSGSCSEIYLEKAFKNGNGPYPFNALPEARALGETSLAFLVDPTFSDERMKKSAETIRKVVSAASMN